MSFGSAITIVNTLFNHTTIQRVTSQVCPVYWSFNNTTVEAQLPGYVTNNVVQILGSKIEEGPFEVTGVGLLYEGMVITVSSTVIEKEILRHPFVKVKMYSPNLLGPIEFEIFSIRILRRYIFMEENLVGLFPDKLTYLNVEIEEHAVVDVGHLFYAIPKTDVSEDVKIINYIPSNNKDASNVGIELLASEPINVWPGSPFVSVQNGTLQVYALLSKMENTMARVIRVTPTDIYSIKRKDDRLLYHEFETNYKATKQDITVADIPFYKKIVKILVSDTAEGPFKITGVGVLFRKMVITVASSIIELNSIEARLKGPFVKIQTYSENVSDKFLEYQVSFVRMLCSNDRCRNESPGNNLAGLFTMDNLKQVSTVINKGEGINETGNLLFAITNGGTSQDFRKINFNILNKNQMESKNLLQIHLNDHKRLLRVLTGSPVVNYIDGQIVVQALLSRVANTDATVIPLTEENVGRIEKKVVSLDRYMELSTKFRTQSQTQSTISLGDRTVKILVSDTPEGPFITTGVGIILEMVVITIASNVIKMYGEKPQLRGYFVKVETNEIDVQYRRRQYAISSIRIIMRNDPIGTNLAGLFTTEKLKYHGVELPQKLTLDNDGDLLYAVDIGGEQTVCSITDLETVRNTLSEYLVNIDFKPYPYHQRVLNGSPVINSIKGAVEIHGLVTSMCETTATVIPVTQKEIEYIKIKNEALQLSNMYVEFDTKFKASTNVIKESPWEPTSHLVKILASREIKGPFKIKGIGVIYKNMILTIASNVIVGYSKGGKLKKPFVKVQTFEKGIEMNVSFIRIFCNNEAHNTNLAALFVTEKLDVHEVELPNGETVGNAGNMLYAIVNDGTADMCKIVKFSMYESDHENFYGCEIRMKNPIKMAPYSVWSGSPIVNFNSNEIHIHGLVSESTDSNMIDKTTRTVVALTNREVGYIENKEDGLKQKYMEFSINFSGHDEGKSESPIWSPSILNTTSDSSEDVTTLESSETTIEAISRNCIVQIEGRRISTAAFDSVCTGTVISDGKILTVASCFLSESQELIVDTVRFVYNDKIVYANEVQVSRALPNVAVLLTAEKVEFSNVFISNTTNCSSEYLLLSIRENNEIEVQDVSKYFDFDDPKIGIENDLSSDKPGKEKGPGQLNDELIVPFTSIPTATVPLIFSKIAIGSPIVQLTEDRVVLRALLAEIAKCNTTKLQIIKLSPFIHKNTINSDTFKSYTLKQGEYQPRSKLVAENINESITDALHILKSRGSDVISVISNSFETFTDKLRNSSTRRKYAVGNDENHVNNEKPYTT